MIIRTRYLVLQQPLLLHSLLQSQTHPLGLLLRDLKLLLIKQKEKDKTGNFISLQIKEGIYSRWLC